jgi:hypothetical protein
MKAVFGLVSLLLALAIVGVLVKKQMRGVSGPVDTPPAGVVIPSTTPGATPQQQSQQIQQQFKQSLDEAMQQTRPMPDDK